MSLEAKPGQSYVQGGNVLLDQAPKAHHQAPSDVLQGFGGYEKPQLEKGFLLRGLGDREGFRKLGGEDRPCPLEVAAPHREIQPRFWGRAEKLQWYRCTIITLRPPFLPRAVGELYAETGYI